MIGYHSKSECNSRPKAVKAGQRRKLRNEPNFNHCEDYDGHTRAFTCRSPLPTVNQLLFTVGPAFAVAHECTVPLFGAITGRSTSRVTKGAGGWAMAAIRGPRPSISLARIGGRPDLSTRTRKRQTSVCSSLGSIPSNHPDWRLPSSWTGYSSDHRRSDPLLPANLPSVSQTSPDLESPIIHLHDD
jgi:hypothetical protein